MAVLPMKRVNIYAMRENRKAILEELQRRGVIEVEKLSINDSHYHFEDTSQKRALFEKNSDIAGNAFKVLEKYIPSDGSIFQSLKGKDDISVEDYYTFVNESTEIMRIAYEVIAVDKEISDLRADIIGIKTQMDAIVPWSKLDVPMRFKGTASTRAFIGSFPRLMAYDDIIDELAATAPELEGYSLEMISESSSQTCVFILCHKDIYDDLENALRNMGFSRPPAPTKENPVERLKILMDRKRDMELTLEERINYMSTFAGMKNALRFMQDYYTMRADKYAVIEKLGNSRRIFILTGYIRADEAQELEEELLNRFSLTIEFEDTEKDEDVPVALKNSPLAEPVETVLETYSLPNRHEVDPTAVMAIFYYIFFGMMFSDAGYGLLMALGCIFALLKFPKMSEGMHKSLKMFMLCGISTMFWGFMFGSFFGDAVNVIATTFFNRPDIAFHALWFNPVDEPMRLFMYSLGFGVVHLFAGLLILAYKNIKNGHIMDAVYDSLSWMLLVGGAILLVMNMDLYADISGSPVSFPEYVMTGAGVAMVIGAIIILLFAGRESRNPFKRLMKGAYGLYGITSYLSDILSYSRLLALGLATSVVANVFNQIGSMFGGGIVGAFAFILVFILGHSLNMGINALGAYVHTNRLQFVEFLGKFYEGGGRKFNPFKINTKHYNIVKEDY